MLPILLDRSVDTPLAVQLAARLRTLVSQGILRANEPVPSTRALCNQLGVSRGTVVSAYDQLVAESYLVSVPGGKTRVHPNVVVLTEPSAGRAVWSQSGNTLSASHQNSSAFRTNQGSEQSAAGALAPTESAEKGRTKAQLDRSSGSPAGSGSETTASRTTPPEEFIDLAPRASRTEPIDDSTWREAWRSAAAAPTLTGQDQRSAAAQGLPQLRSAISEHLRLMRSMDVNPDDIVVTTGARDGLFLTILALNAQGDQSAQDGCRAQGSQSAPANQPTNQPDQTQHAHRPTQVSRIAVESPGYPGLRRAMVRAGAQAVPVAVDAAGMVGTNIPENTTAALITPNHMYPIGGVIPAPRRLELLAEASERDMYLIEDDLDSDARHVGPVLPTLWELAPERVVHLGTFNQVLSAEVRIGYLIVPKRLQLAMDQVLSDLGASASTIAQRALATYLEHGGLRRQITKSRRGVVRRRALVEHILAGYVPQINASAHAVVELPSHELAVRAKKQCEDRGVRVGELAEYWGKAAFDQPDMEVSGLVLSYSDVPLRTLERSLNVIKKVIDEL